MYKGRPTIHKSSSFNDKADCEKLQKAMKGLGTNESAIIDVLTKRNSDEREELKSTYHSMYKKDLVSELKSELSGDFRELMLYLMEHPTTLDVKTVAESISGKHPEEHTMIEILCTRDPKDVDKIRDGYNKMYSRDLADDIEKAISPAVRRLLLSILQNKKDRLSSDDWNKIHKEGPDHVVDHSLAKKEAEELHRASGKDKYESEDSVFVKLVCKRHTFQLEATFEEYSKLAGKDIFSCIAGTVKKKNAGTLKLMALSQFSIPTLFGILLHLSMKGFGTKEKVLSRIIVTRAEIDLEDIKEQFEFQQDVSLSKAVADETSGDYKKALLSIIAGNH